MQATPQALPQTSAFNQPPSSRLAFRFFWKECRRLAGLSIGIALIATTLMVVLTFFIQDRAQPSSLMLMIAFGGTAMHAIAASVTLFAVEKEEGTADLLRILPRNVGGMILGKGAALCTSIIIVLAALSIIAFGMAGSWPSGADASLILSQGTAAIAEAIAFGLLASLVCPYPLVAAILGITLASLNSQLAIALFVPKGFSFETSTLQAALPARWVFVAMASVIDWWLATKWLSANPTKILRSRPHTLAKATAPRTIRRGWLQAFARLIWQSVRQSWGVALVISLLGIGLTVTFALIVGLFNNFNSSWETSLGVLGVLFTPSLLGAMVFRADQRGEQYRFLPAHAGRPHLVWLARTLTWLTPTMLVTGIVCFAATAFAFYYSEFDYQRQWYWQYYSVDGSELLSQLAEKAQTNQEIIRIAILTGTAVFTAFAYGQFFSIALRSEVLAAILALICSVVVMTWSTAVGFARLSSLWFVLPIGLGALLASWLRVKSWMLDRRGLSRWVLPVLALLLPIALVLKATPAARLSQVPPLYSSSYINKADSPSSNASTFNDVISQAKVQIKRGQEVADSYQRIASHISEDLQNSQLSEADYSELIRLSKEECRLPLPFIQYGEQSKIIEKLQFAALQKNRETKKNIPAESTSASNSNNLDQQLERILLCRRLAAQQSNGQSLTNAFFPQYLSQELLDWATAENQTPERLLHAIDELQQIEKMHLGPANRLSNNYLQVLAVLRGEALPSFFNRQPNERDNNLTPKEWLTFLANDLPGESERAQRSLKILATIWTQYLQNFESTTALQSSASKDLSMSHVREGLQQYFHLSSVTSALTANQSFGYRYQFPEIVNLVHNAQTSYLAAHEFIRPWDISNSIHEWVSVNSWWRAERIRLALIAYKLKHNNYPVELKELSPEYLQPWQYLDPFINKPFGYSREGFVYRTAKINSYMHRVDLGIIPPKTPVLWSSGTGDAKPRMIRIRIEQQNGTLIESVIDENSDKDEIEESIPVMDLEPQRRYWAWGQFWIPIPK